MKLLPRSIRGRLWAALAVLSIAIIGIGALTWVALQRVESNLEDLHRQSLTQVAQAIDLSKRVSDLATSAPYLLNQRSNYLIEQEGNKLIAILQTVRQEWPGQETSGPQDEVIFPVTQEMERGIEDLVGASQALDAVQSQIRARVAVLSSLREQVASQIADPEVSDAERLVWWTLQSMNADALNAAYADNLIGVGEEQRQFQRQGVLAAASELTEAQQRYLAELQRQVGADDGIFELRREELGFVLSAQNALFRIRRDANRVNEIASEFARDAEEFLTAERTASTNTIQLTRISVTGIGLLALLCALAAAMFVSRYVAFNIARVSEAMVRLAKGDRTSALPRKLGGDDEIGDLFRSFRSFRANALRLDRSNRQLDQRNALFEKVFANISVGIAITDASGRLTASNPGFANILDLGPSERITGSFADWLESSRFSPVSKDAKLSAMFRGHLEMISEQGQILELRASRLPDDGRVWLIADVTENRKVASRLEQIDRIETLGKLAGDTAHDFGNILSTIRTHAHLLSAGQGDAVSANVVAIENAVEFGASLTDRLLAFARRQPLVPELVDLNGLVEGMIELVEIGLKSGITLDVAYSPEPLTVLVDPGQLESAILNLVLNSNNAIDTKGRISITLSRNGAGAAVICVADTGAGMTEQHQQKAIEPFYTTRSAEGGTGLGLSIVYGFINQTGGSMEIDSAVGAGTSVKIALPVATGKSRAPESDPRSVLVIDDNAADRRAAVAMLERMGFSVAQCDGPEQAFAILKDRHFDVVFSDFDLGDGPNGLAVLSCAEVNGPSVQKFLMSGKRILDSALPSDVRFLEKPLDAGMLNQALAPDPVQTRKITFRDKA